MESLNLRELERKHPILEEMKYGQEIFWINPHKGENTSCRFTMADIDDAEARLARFAPYLEKAFPETAATKGIIESELKEIPYMKETLEAAYGDEIEGRLFLKCDSHLPVSGSIKARGGIYEVLKFAEETAIANGMLTLTDDYSILCEDRFKELFSKYSVAVGSTGNLGLSIGIMSAKLGFKVTVHMSADARQWKKDLLRSKGVNVIEYPDDYGKAVAEGRKEAAADPMCHFVDDESSVDLFMGYAVAAKRLAKQFEEQNILVDSHHPLNVYIPCGVGGAPGGVAFGLHMIFGDAVHCYFAEPTHAPCMTLGLITGLYDKIAVGDIGLDGKTAADGLAVGRASSLVSEIMSGILEGCFTVQDDELYCLLTLLADTEDIYVEPSACAAFPGLTYVEATPETTHIIWATGGSMVPEEEMNAYYQKGRELLGFIDDDME